MDYKKKYGDLKSIYNNTLNINTLDNEMEVAHLPFNSECYWQRIFDEANERKEGHFKLGVPDSHYFENNHFTYPVFLPNSRNKYKKAIILLHGLNERSWVKYLPWAYFLAHELQRPVILFPIAFHINRAPLQWLDVRSMAPYMNERKANLNPSSLSYANAALSIRISEDPLRFLKSGHQTTEDLRFLMKQLQEGLLPFFEKDTQIDFFAYSIGAFIAQIMLIAYPETLMSNSKLFLFCGGAYFEDMNGISRMIMDGVAFDRLRNYYISDIYNALNESKLLSSLITEFPLGRAFYSMLKDENNSLFRNNALTMQRKNVYGVGLENDKVIPARATLKVFSNSFSNTSNFDILDFPFEYSHEIPFPVQGNVDHQLVNTAFTKVFSKAVDFLN